MRGGRSRAHRGSGVSVYPFPGTARTPLHLSRSDSRRGVLIWCTHNQQAGRWLWKSSNRCSLGRPPREIVNGRSSAVRVRKGKGHGRSFTGAAGQRDGPAVDFDDALGDRESQSRNWDGGQARVFGADNASDATAINGGKRLSLRAQCPPDAAFGAVDHPTTRCGAVHGRAGADPGPVPVPRVPQNRGTG